MRIAVYGAGAIGGSLGGFLAQAGEDVLIVDPFEEHVAAMQRGGLTLDGITGEHRVPVTAITPAELDDVGGAFDLVIIGVKSYDTIAAVERVVPFLHDESWVVTPQNGLNELLIAPRVGAARTLGCVTVIAAAMNEPGRVTRTQRTGTETRVQATPVSYIVGELDGRITPRLERLAELLTPSGRTVTTDNLWGQRWTKLATNAMLNPMAAITGLLGYDMKADDRTRRFIFRLGLETVRVGRSLGYPVGIPVAGFELGDLERAATQGHGELETAFVGERPAVQGRPSMGQDILKGRATEIHQINGVVAAHGERIGVPTPCCIAAVEAVARIERGELTPSVDNLDLLERLAPES
jgi:2-dehydropantoate 2-reductase